MEKKITKSEMEYIFGTYSYVRDYEWLRENHPFFLGLTNDQIWDKLIEYATQEGFIVADIGRDEHRVIVYVSRKRNSVADSALAVDLDGYELYRLYPEDLYRFIKQTSSAMAGIDAAVAVLQS